MSEEHVSGTIMHEAGSDVVERKRSRVADTFRRDERLEEMLSLRAADPDRFERLHLPPRELLALDYYATARKAATELALAEQEEDEAA